MTVSLGFKWWPVASWRQVLPGNCSRSSKQTHLETSSRASSSNSTESLLERKSGKKCVQVGGLFKSMSRFLQLLDDNWFHRTLLNKWLCNRTIETIETLAATIICQEKTVGGKHNWKMAFKNICLKIQNYLSQNSKTFVSKLKKYLSQNSKIFVSKLKDIFLTIKKYLSRN